MSYTITVENAPRYSRKAKRQFLAALVRPDGTRAADAIGDTSTKAREALVDFILATAAYEPTRVWYADGTIAMLSRTGPDRYWVEGRGPNGEYRGNQASGTEQSALEYVGHLATLHGGIKRAEGGNAYAAQTALCPGACCQTAA